MQPEKKLHYIQNARKEAYKIFTEMDEEAARKRKLQYWKNLGKSFLYSCLFLGVMILIAKLVVN
jgi:hypothetical protein